jgi:hypothetical protein
MTALTRRRAPEAPEMEQLRTEVAMLRAEAAELREALQAVAHLVLGVGHTLLPRNDMAAPPRDIPGLCRVYGVFHRAPAIGALFERRD